jgi:tetratricopeptide (TPR) repeat protein
MRKIRRYPSPVLLDLIPAPMADWIVRRALRKAAQRGDSEASQALLHFFLAKIAQRRQDAGRAEDYLRKAIAADPDYASMYHCEIARTRKAQGDYAGAAQHLKAALEALPPDAGEGFREWVKTELQECSEKAFGR